MIQARRHLILLWRSWFCILFLGRFFGAWNGFDPVYAETFRFEFDATSRSTVESSRKTYGELVFGNPNVFEPFPVEKVYDKTFVSWVTDLEFALRGDLSPSQYLDFKERLRYQTFRPEDVRAFSTSSMKYTHLDHLFNLTYGLAVGEVDAVQLDYFHNIYNIPIDPAWNYQSHRGKARYHHRINPKTRLEMKGSFEERTYNNNRAWNYQESIAAIDFTQFFPRRIRYRPIAASLRGESVKDHHSPAIMRWERGHKHKGGHWEMMVAVTKKMVVLALVMVVSVGTMGCSEPVVQGAVSGNAVISLPAPQHTGKMSVEEAIFRRQSTRQFTDGPLTLAEVSQLLWSAGGKTIDGVTGPTRAFPSAGGLYPLDIYLVVGNVTGLDDGVYRFRWKDRSLEMRKKGDVREELTAAALGQGFVRQAPVSIVWVGDFARIERTYRSRGVERYIMMDVGGAGQNVHLQAETLGLGTVIIGAFRDDQVQRVLGTELMPLYIMPVGRRN